MERPDKHLAFMLRYENIAWFEDGAVRILDRRVYPGSVSFVTCETHREVARAVTDMVTQSAGPYTAAAMGMALAAHECRRLKAGHQKRYLQKAARTLAGARPTTAERMKLITDACLNAASEAIDQGRNAADEVVRFTVERNNIRYRKIGRMAEYLVDLFPKDARIITQCFGETIVGMMLQVARQRNNALKIFCPETRPYFQGARLTATVCYEMGFDTTVITDNMSAFTMQREGIDVFTSAADAVCLDGHIVNKVGTLQMAIAANHFGIPYYAAGAPDKGHPVVDTVVIEERDPEFVLQAMGVRTAAEGVKGYYPAFDITPPHLVSGVITDTGIYSPFDLHRYFAQGAEGEY